MLFSLCCLFLYYKHKRSKEYEIHSIGKSEKYNRHRSLL